MVLMLSPQQLGQLMPLTPALMAWLRQSDEGSAGELFLSAEMNMDEVQSTLRELLNAQNYNGDLNNVQIRYICSCHPMSTWVNAVRLILTECDPRLVSNELGNALIGAMDKVQAAEDAEQVSHVIGPLLDQMPRSHFVAFGEFCALLRDTMEDPTQLAMMVGPMLLAPRTGVAANSVSSAAGTILLIMITEAESIFGRPGAKSEKPAFGIRKAPPKPKQRRNNNQSASGSQQGGQEQKVTPPPGIGGSGAGGSGSPQEQQQNATEARDEKRKQQLRAFYQWRDPGRADKVPLLFENHDFEDIAYGIQRKYGMLPPGWKTDLADLKAKGNQKLDWFEDAPKSKMKTGQNGLPAVPQTQNARPVSTRGGGNAGSKKSGGHLDQIIDEICDSEQSYHDSLAELLESYVKTIRAISSGQKGQEAALALGLSSAEVEQIFGWRLEEIIHVSDSLLSKLEPVSVVRSQPKTAEGRQGLIADAFAEIANELHVYAPYVSSHKSSLGSLEKALQKMKDKSKEKKGGLGTQLLQRGKDKNNASEMNFVKLWEVVSNASQRLKGQTLQSMLIMPVQRVPRYKMLMREVIKETPSDHAAMPKLEKANDLIMRAAKEINEALRQHEKLSKFFGDDEMLNPTTSAVKNKNGKGGYGIQQGYVDGI